jgi:ATP-dependent RNA helicase DDX56/DBP9
LFVCFVCVCLEEGRKIVPYEFKTSIVESFRYRVENILRSVTRQDIKEARLEDIRVEILNSDRLKVPQ